MSIISEKSQQKGFVTPAFKADITIHLDAPNVGKIEKRFIAKAIDSGFVSTIGPFVEEFEDNFAAYLKTKKCVSLQSGTSGLYMSLCELGIKKGDEVIVPAVTFVATVNPIIQLGAEPVFVDIDRETFSIDSVQLEKALTGKTRAVIPVHLYGNPCDMDSIMKIARKYGIFVVEDATESLGATIKGKHTGTFGDFGVFSFNGNKIITTGGGGMIASNNVKAVNHIRFLINQAKSEIPSICHSEIGFNYRMTNIEAALGQAQMTKLDSFLSKKKEFNRIYREELENSGFVRFQKEGFGCKSSFWLNTVVFEKGTDINKLQAALSKKGVPTRRIFAPIVQYPPYRKFAKRNCYNSLDIYNKGLCLPSSTLNTADDIYYSCRCLKEILR